MEPVLRSDHAPTRKHDFGASCGAWAAAFFLLVVSSSARAEPAPSALPADATLQGLIADSLGARPELAEARAIVRANDERVPQAGALPDPMLQIGIQNDGFSSIEIGRMATSFVSFMASQTFPWPGKLGLRQDIAKLGSGQAAQVVARVRLSTEAEVRRAYLALVLVRDRLGLLDQLDAIWQQSLALARVRYEAGDGAQSDVLRAQLELNRLRQRRFALTAQARSSVQAINRLRARPLDQPIETSTHIRDLPALARLEKFFSVERELGQSPELAAARLATTRTDKAAALAKKSYYPDLTVTAGIMYRGDLPPMWLATVGAPVPVFAGTKQSRAVAESGAWVSAAQKEVTSVEQVLRLRSEERHTAFSALVQTINLYQQGLLVQSEATAESTLSQYKVGRVPFASVLEANAGFIADEEGFLESVAAAHRILIDEAEVSLVASVMPGAGPGPSAAMPGAGGSDGSTSSM